MACQNCLQVISLQNRQGKKLAKVGLPSVIFGRKLKRLLKDYYCIDVKVVFSSFKVKKLFFPEVPYPYALDGQCRISIYMFA